MLLQTKILNHRICETALFVCIRLRNAWQHGDKGQTVSGRQWPLLQYFSLSLQHPSALQQSFTDSKVTHMGHFKNYFSLPGT